MKRGLEAWFQDPASVNPSPPIYKTSILMWLVLFPLTLFCQWFLKLMNLHLSPLIATGTTMAFEIAVVSYLLMPALARLLGSWLYAR
jgi:antibiotic biosynthesis monooxygenase (ABM) superfamily enzyme